MAHATPNICQSPDPAVNEEIDGGKLYAAENRLREFSDAARDAARDDLAACADLFAKLLEIVRYNTDNEPVSAEFSAITDFVKTRIPLLRAAKEKAGPFEELDATIEEIQQRWGDYIRLLDDAPWQPPAEPADLCEPDFLETDVYAEEDVDGICDETESDEPTKEEIELILSACGPAPERQPQGSSPQTSDCGRTRGESEAAAVQQTVAASPRSPIVIPRIEQVELDGELLEAYLDDARGCLSSMEEAVIAFEADSSNRQCLHQLCRELHTLKGASASVGLDGLASQLHAVEDALLASGTDGHTPDLESVLSSVDAVRRQIAVLSDRNGVSNDADTTTTSNGLPGPRRASPVELSDSSSDKETVRVRTSQLDRLMDMLAELVILRNRRQSCIARLDHTGNQINRCVSQLRHLAGGRAPVNVEERQKQRWRRSSSTNPYAETIQELLKTVADLREMREPIAEENQAISQFVRQFRQELTELRRLPIAGLLRRLQRSARDAARIEGKQVRMELEGEHSGLERSLQEQLYPALLHIVRNAVSHGIEAESERRAAGKDPIGTVTLQAMGGANLLMLVVRDDGAGLDYESIRRRGIERGWIAADRPANRQELAQLIFRPGFSTRNDSSEVSGRGVGMDVVAATLERVRGWVEVESEPGQGTSVHLAVPLRSVIEHVMAFRAGDQLFALPMSFVIRATGSVAGEDFGAGRAQDSDSEPSIPFVELLSNSTGDRSAATGKLIIGHGQASPRRRDADQAATDDESPRQARRLSILVDEVLGPEEVVVRPMPPLLARQELFSAVTLSGTGEIVLLIDARRLLDTGLRRLQKQEVSPAGTPNKESCEAVDAVTYLVVDDSRSARRKLSQILKRHGVSVEEAEDGAEALQRLAQNTYHAVFTDLEMPRLNGMDLLREIKRSPDSSALDVIMVSSRRESEYQRVAKRLGAADYLVKPVTQTSLCEVLEKLSQRRSQPTQSGGGNE